MSKKTFDQNEFNRVKGIIAENAQEGSVAEGVFTTGEEAPIYPKTIPQDSWTMEDEEKIDNHRSLFIAAGVDVVGDKTLAALKKDSSVTSGVGSFSLGSGGSVGVKVVPEKSYNNSFAKEGEPNTIIKHGVVSVDVTTVGGKTGPALSSVRDSLAEAFAAQLKK